LTYEHQDGLADFVVTKNALHILPDFWKMILFSGWLRCSNLMVCSTSVMSYSLSSAEYETSINEWIQQVAKPEGEGWTAKTLRCMCEKNTALCMDY